MKLPLLAWNAGSIVNSREDRVIMERVCEACRQPISDEERWFRVREEYVHISCYEKYLKLVSERRQQAKAAPAKPAPHPGG
jgi:hypothetical protein